MTESINVAEAKAKLSSLIDRAAAGEEIVIARAGKPLARLVPLEVMPKRQFGSMRDRWAHIADDLFLLPATEEELRWAEGHYQDREGLYRKAAGSGAARTFKATRPRKAPRPR